MVATITKKKEVPTAVTTAVSDGLEVARELAGRRQQLWAALEAAIRHTLETGEPFQNLNVIQRELGLSGLQLQSQFDRMREVLRHQSLAGTSAERAKALGDLQHAEESIKAELPALLEQQAEIARKIEGLKARADGPRTIVERHHQAVKMLTHKMLLPPDLVERFQDRRDSLHCSDVGVRLRDARSRRDLVKSVIALHARVTDGGYVPNVDTGSREIAMHCDAIRADRGIDLFTGGDVDRDKWANYIDGLERELPAVEGEVADLEAEYAAMVQAVDREAEAVYCR